MRTPLNLALLVMAVLAGGLAAAPRAEAQPYCLEYTGYGCVHWQRFSGQSQATVYLLDWTGSRWPVGAAANKMSESPKYNSWRRSGSLGCPRRTPSLYHHCVGVYEYYNAGDGRAGVTYYGWNGAGHLAAAYTATYLNNYWGDTWPSDYNRAVACHEIGHVAGLGHEWPPTDSCMQDPPSTNGTWPNPADFNLVYAIYNH